MGGDATVIQGVNTAGTVRVNNLANLEQLLSVLASVIQIAGIGLAVFLASEALQKGELKLGKLNLTKSKGLAAALVLAAAGACSPQFVNWLVASLRDANIFS